MSIDTVSVIVWTLVISFMIFLIIRFFRWLGGF